jgi:hypothetical protein
MAQMQVAVDDRCRCGSGEVPGSPEHVVDEGGRPPDPEAFHLREKLSGAWNADRHVHSCHRIDEKVRIRLDSVKRAQELG